MSKNTNRAIKTGWLESLELIVFILLLIVIAICSTYKLSLANTKPVATAAVTHALTPLSSAKIKISLSQAIKRALSNQGNVLKAEHIVAQNTALKKAAYANLMPDISIVGGGIWTQMRNGSPLFVSADGMRELVGQVTLTVPIFDPKSYAIISLAKNNLKVVKYRLKLARLVVAAQVAQYFYGLILLKNEVKVKEKAFDSAKKILTAAKIRYKAGDLPRFDVVQTELIVIKLRTNLEVLKSEVKSLERVFLTEIFYNNVHNAKLSLHTASSFYYFNYKIPKVDRLIQIALKKQPLIKIAKSEIQSARADVSVNKAAKLPTIQGGGAYGEDTINSFDGPNLGWQFFVALNIPIYNFGLHSDYIDAADERLMALKSAKSAIELSIKKRLEKDYGLAEASKKGLHGAKILVKKSGEVFKMTEEGYLVGTFNALELQEAQNNWVKSRIEFVKAINVFYLTIAQLDIDMGIIPSGAGKL